VEARIERKSEELAHAGAHKLDSPLHIRACRVGHHIRAAAGTQALHKSESIIRFAVDVDDHNFIGLRQHLGQILKPGRE
jgi:hypothetical protein